MTEPLPLGSALLFCPGNRPDRFAKAATRADAVVLELEDAVAPAEKDAARAAVASALRPGDDDGATVTAAVADARPAVGDGVTSANIVDEVRVSASAAVVDPARTVVRVNAASGPAFADDVAALAGTAVRYVMLPKAERPEDLDHLTAALPGVGVVALCETTRGVLATSPAPSLAESTVLDRDSAVKNCTVGGGVARGSGGGSATASRRRRCRRPGGCPARSRW